MQKRGVARKTIRTKSGVKEIMVERRTIDKAGENAPEDVPAIAAREPLLPIAAEVHYRTRFNRFPVDFYEG